jgi:peptidoglycan/xylan/chitin deacetylase (PgdA/CDA1 family)
MTLGIIFHHFVGQGHPRIQGALSADEFERFLDRVGAQAILHPEDWMQARIAGELRPGQVCLTFDDALRSQVDVALPVLHRRGLKAFFFVYSSIFEGRCEPFEVYRYFKNLAYRDMDAFYREFYAELFSSHSEVSITGQLAAPDAKGYLAQYSFYTDEDRRFRYIRDRILSEADYQDVMARLMARRGMTPEGLAAGVWIDDEALARLVEDGHTIGLHSHTHPTNMGVLSRDVQRWEYDRNVAHLERVLGRRPVVMAHPSGSYNDDTLDILRDLGVLVGFRSDDRVGSGSLLELPRLDYKIFDERLAAGRLASMELVSEPG